MPEYPALAAIAREEQGDDVTVFEKQSQVGGVLKSKIMGLFTRLRGKYFKFTLQKSKSSLKNFTYWQAIDADHNCSKRFIVRNSKIIALPTGFFSFLTTIFKFSGKTKITY